VRTARPFQFAGLYERIDHPPPPLAGGQPGAAGRLATSNDVPLRAKETTMLPPETVVTIEIPGGGGYGEPHERDPALVLADVRGGYVSEAAARERYGVAIDTANWKVDTEVTRGLRRR
jgi:N-methylhydantoinase B/oxoprolinase/acetone carboxylase alpha subunit